MTQPTLAGLNAGPPAKRNGDHKRKARPIAPATVTVRDGEIVVVVPDVLGKNESHKAGRHLSKATVNMRQAVKVGVSVLIDKATRGWPTPTWATDGPWRAEVLGVWPRQRDLIEGRKIGFEAPMGDADAPVSQAFDALKHGGVLDDDARIVLVTAANLYRKGERWTVIRLVRVPDLAERDAAIAHLVAMLPPPSAVAPVAKRKRAR
jgi:Holliday junction resolvase RusA-like endonuclease